MTAPCRGSGRRELGDALADIEGLADTLVRLGESDKALNFLGYQLTVFHHKAHDAFCRIYRLDDYAPGADQPPEPGR